MKKSIKAFSLAELLIVVAIIAVLVGVAIPVFVHQLDSSKLASDKANIRNCYAVASTDYELKEWDGSAKDYTEGDLVCTAESITDGVRVTVKSGYKSDAISTSTYYERGVFYNIEGENNPGAGGNPGGGSVEPTEPDPEPEPEDPKPTQAEIDAAKKAWDDAAAYEAQMKTAYDNAVTNEATKQSAYDTAVSNESSAKTNYENKTAEYNRINKDPRATNGQKNAAKKAMNDAGTVYTNATNAKNSASAELNNAKTATQTASTNYNNAKTSTANAKAAYEALIAK